MTNKIKITSINAQYSYIEVEKNNIISKHIVSNTGWADLEYWVKYFTYEF